jgi:hypothetical protein
VSKMWIAIAAISWSTGVAVGLTHYPRPTDQEIAEAARKSATGPVFVCLWGADQHYTGCASMSVENAVNLYISLGNEILKYFQGTGQLPAKIWA